MSYEAFIEDVRVHGGFETAAEAERAIRATISVLGRCLEDVDAREIADHLPRPLASILDALEHTDDLSMTEFFERVSRREGVSIGAGRERVLIVCQALARVLPPSTRLRMPAGLAPLFELPSVAEGRAGPRPARAPTAHTLADGRPGSQHPLSEAHPPAGQAHSLAATDDPHSSRRLSSAHPGQSQETLATGKPGSEHPIADKK